MNIKQAIATVLSYKSASSNDDWAAALDTLEALSKTADPHVESILEYAEHSLSEVAKDFGLTYTPPTKETLWPQT